MALTSAGWTSPPPQRFSAAVLKSQTLFGSALNLSLALLHLSAFLINKIFAKLGSDMQKPDATTVITPDSFQAKVWPLPAGDLLYVGRATEKKLAKYFINTIGDLANTSPEFLHRLLGKNGIVLWQFANGLDTSPVSKYGSRPLIKSIGNSTTAPRDLISEDDIKITLYALCESVSARLREQNFICRTVQITVRDKYLISYERQGKLDYPNRTGSL